MQQLDLPRFAEPSCECRRLGSLMVTVYLIGGRKKERCGRQRSHRTRYDPDRCETGHGYPNVRWDLSSRLYESWKAYAVRAGEEAGSSKAFAQALQKRGFEGYREPNTGSRGFKCIRLMA